MSAKSTVAPPVALAVIVAVTELVAVLVTLTVVVAVTVALVLAVAVLDAVALTVLLLVGDTDGISMQPLEPAVLVYPLAHGMH